MTSKRDPITLWAGDGGVRLDESGNIYDVNRKTPVNRSHMLPDMVSMYQQILRENGFEVKETVSEPDPLDGSVVCAHEITGRYYHKILVVKLP